MHTNSFIDGWLAERKQTTTALTHSPSFPLDIWTQFCLEVAAFPDWEITLSCLTRVCKTLYRGLDCIWRNLFALHFPSLLKPLDFGYRLSDPLLTYYFSEGEDLWSQAYSFRSEEANWAEEIFIKHSLHRKLKTIERNKCLLDPCLISPHFAPGHSKWDFYDYGLDTSQTTLLKDTFFIQPSEEGSNDFIHLYRKSLPFFNIIFSWIFASTKVEEGVLVTRTMVRRTAVDEDEDEYAEEYEPDHSLVFFPRLYTNMTETKDEETVQKVFLAKHTFLTKQSISDDSFDFLL